MMVQGSSRYSTNSPKLSEYLTNILNSFNLDIRADFNKDYNSIINRCKYSKVSDYFRFMKYVMIGWAVFDKTSSTVMIELDLDLKKLHSLATGRRC